MRRLRLLVLRAAYAVVASIRDWASDAGIRLAHAVWITEGRPMATRAGEHELDDGDDLAETCAVLRGERRH